MQDSAGPANQVEPYLIKVLNHLKDGVYRSSQFTDIELDDLQLHTGLYLVEIKVARAPPQQAPHVVPDMSRKHAADFLRTAGDTNHKTKTIRRCTLCLNSKDIWGRHRITCVCE